MSSASDPAEEIECSYEDDSFETAEESILADHRSSPIVWSRRESVFLAESSNSTSSAEDTQVFGETVSGSNERTPSVQSASTITEEQDYSDQFETLGSEGELSIKDETISGTNEQEEQENFVRKKLAVLSSRHSSSKKQSNYRERRDQDKTTEEHQEVNNFCSRKLKIMELRKQEVADSEHAGETIVPTTGGQPHLQDQYIDGNKRKIESLRIENLMKKADKLKEQDFYNPRHCTDCRKMKSSIANNMFLKRKLEIAKRAEFEERLQIHMYQKDSATLLAEIVNSCTKATAPPSEVWEKLLHK
ncbi:hypothetical protein ACROYT_G018037 [Oculina patagonica]